MGPNLRIPNAIDDQQRHGGQRFHEFFASPVESGFRNFLQQDMRLTVDSRDNLGR